MEKINFTNGQAPAINDMNLNQMQKNIEKAIEEVEDKLNYSTEEKVVGTWKDGRPIYRKVIDFGVLNNAQGSKNIAHEINDIDTIIDIRAIGYEGTYAFPIPFVGNDFMFAGVSYSIRVNKTDIWIYVSDDRSMDTAIVTLEYTKTTDTV